MVHHYSLGKIKQAVYHMKQDTVYQHALVIIHELQDMEELQHDLESYCSHIDCVLRRRKIEFPDGRTIHFQKIGKSKQISLIMRGMYEYMDVAYAPIEELDLLFSRATEKAKIITY